MKEQPIKKYDKMETGYDSKSIRKLIWPMLIGYLIAILISFLVGSKLIDDTRILILNKQIEQEILGDNEAYQKFKKSSSNPSYLVSIGAICITISSLIGYNFICLAVLAIPRDSKLFIVGVDILRDKLDRELLNDSNDVLLRRRKLSLK